ncbi:MAG: hypothetical protein J5477_05405 [Schwartzia sp.]|nr:hypothetical protein [Schwartzia sp. (in: firmicutes)]
MEPDYIYGDAEREIVKSGYEAIEAVLAGYDMNAKRRLLFYLDWYIDPYYKNDLTNLYEPLKELLQEMVTAENEDDVIADALFLLESYTEPPYERLRESIDMVPQQFLPKARYLINLKD